MDCTTVDSAKELQLDDKASSTGNNIIVLNEDVTEQVDNPNPTTSGNSSTNVAKNPVIEEEEEKCLENNNSSNNEGQDDTKTSSSPAMMIPTTMIVKGKRTKRQRIHSPIIGEQKCSNNQEDVQVITDEDEELEMANCLILLARGPPMIRRNELGLFTSYRGTSIRFTSSNKRPCYNNGSVYECKTCNRTFPSFQALGGHRASHKKLKITTTNMADNDYSYSRMVTVASPSPSPLCLQLGNINYTAPTTPMANVGAQNNMSNKSRIHECAICGAEFSSGQALGGHMRRHRGPVMPLNSSTTTTTTTTTTINKPQPFANTTLSLSTAANNAVAVAALETKENRMSDGFLSLDLNMPASASPSPLPPVQDHQNEAKLSMQQPQPSSGMVLTPSLVDCSY